LDNRIELSAIREELRTVERRVRLFAAGLPHHGRASHTRGASLRAVTLIASAGHELDAEIAELAPVVCGQSGELVG